MTLYEYAYKLNILLKNHPEYAMFEVVYSGDAEGNDYSKIYYGPTVGNFNGMGFVPEKYFEDYEINEKNAICVN